MREFRIQEGSPDTPEAEAEFSKSVEAEPSHALAWQQRDICREQNNPGLAIENFSRAAMFYSRDDWKGDAYFNRARCHEGAGRINEAIEDYQQAVSHGIQQGMFESVRLREAHGIE